jgi:S1-C subfamily serine protease
MHTRRTVVIAIALLLWTTVCGAQNLLERFEHEVADLVEMCAPRIVSVQAEFPDYVTASGENGFLNVGSGFVVDTAGYVVTSTAVVTYRSSVADAIIVLDYAQTPHQAMLFGVDSSLQVAFLYVPSLGRSPAVEMRVEPWESGRFALVIGNSSGVSPAVSLTTVAGVRPDGLFWQLSAPATPGLSGAPVFDSQGRLGGILIGEVAGPSTGTSRPMPALMAPSDRLRNAFQRSLRPARVNGRPWLGITVRPQVNTNGIVRVFVTKVLTDSPAQQAGVEPGDLLLDIDGVSIGYVSDLADWIHNSRPGYEATLSVQRGGHQQSIAVTIGRR